MPLDPMDPTMQTSEKASRPTLIVMGVTGSGKTSVGSVLAQRLGVDFVDGDDLHPAANVAKMKRGEPLEDADRWPWLDRVGAVLGDGAAHRAGVVVTCSALRRVYRDRIRAGAAGAEPCFLFLDIAPDVSAARLMGRKGHFMPVSLVRSQFDTLERPAADETDVLTIEETHGVEETADKAVEALARAGEAR